jgi:hypothetical protein
MSLLPIFGRSGIQCVDDMGADDNKIRVLWLSLRGWSITGQGEEQK